MKGIQGRPGTKRMETCILAGDVGGTNANLALVGKTGGRYVIKRKFRFPSTEIVDFSDPVRDVLAELRSESPELSPEICCISAAGPVSSNRCRPTNLTWTIDGDALTGEFALPTRIINDFEALSYSLPLLDTNDGRQIVELPHPGGRMVTPSGTTWAVTGAGTGLGLSFLTKVGGDYIGHPTEGGHSDFAPFDEETEALRSFVSTRCGCVPDAELFLSGRGMANIFLYLRESDGFAPEPLADEIASSEEDAIPPLITKNVDTSPACKKTMKLFFRIYGRFAGIASLFILPYAGMFVAGGIVARHIKTLTEDDDFMVHFESHQHPVMRKVLENIPVFVIRDYSTSLIGAANAAASIFGVAG